MEGGGGAAGREQSISMIAITSCCKPASDVIFSEPIFIRSFSRPIADCDHCRLRGSFMTFFCNLAVVSIRKRVQYGTVLRKDTAWRGRKRNSCWAFLDLFADAVVTIPPQVVQTAADRRRLNRRSCGMSFKNYRALRLL